MFINSAIEILAAGLLRSSNNLLSLGSLPFILKQILYL